MTLNRNKLIFGFLISIILLLLSLKLPQMSLEKKEPKPLKIELPQMSLETKEPKPLKIEEFLEKENSDLNLMERRKAVLQSGCDRWKSTIDQMTDENSRTNILLWREHLWGCCTIAKAGSTTVIKIIGAIQSKETRNPSYLDRLFFLKENKASRDEIKDMAINGYKNSFVVVRHPFRRIISAFRAIVRFGRYDRKEGEDFVGNDLLKYRTKVPEDPDYEAIPTFEEFALFLTQMPPITFNHHYRPACLVCLPCYINYTVIMHLENLEDEIHYLADETGIKEISYTKENKYERLHKDEELALNGKYDVIKLEKFYFSKLSKELFDELYKVYQPDFDLFDYTIPPFDTYILN